MDKQIYLKQVQGNTLIAKASSNHWVVLDAKKESGGSEAATTPKELLLIALAGCTSMDVIAILKKKRADLVDYECIVTGKEADEHPKKFTSIHIEYILYGNLKPDDVERAIELSRTKYCSVSAQLEAGATITHSYTIKNPSDCIAQ